MKTLLTFLILITVSSLISQTKMINDEVMSFSDPNLKENCSADIKFDPAIHQNSGFAEMNLYPAFTWPFVDDLDDGNVLSNYIDHQSGSGISDYEGGEWAYSGHRGTDICVYNFRAMDRFVKVIAAASGVVEQIVFNNYDRNTSCTGNANLVLIRHNDGSYAYYYHFMKRSVTVRVGEYVNQGDVLGYIGSSGCSTDAHLHFEPGRFVDGDWEHRDPWNGTNNSLPSLWQSQSSYLGNRTFKAFDMGVYTASLVANDISVYPTAEMKEGIYQPNTISGYESKIGVWVLLQGNYTGKQVRFEIRKPNGSLFDDTYFYLNDYEQYSKYVWPPLFNPGISETGNWYARVLYDNVEKMRVYFNVQLLTSNRPRLYPAAAKCFRRSLFVQKDTLRVRPVRSNMQYDLVGAPSNVTLTNDSILNIGAFTQTFRETTFKVIASIGGSTTLRDTMLYKLIDTTKNIFPGNGIASLELNAKIEGFWNGTDMVEDTVTVFLRNALSPYNIADFYKVKLNDNGYGIANFIYANPSNYYYIVLKHRNSIETWSKTSQQFINGFPIDYDFTTSKTKAYGDNLKLKSGEYCLYSGDTNQDGIVDGADVSRVENETEGFHALYTAADLDGDQSVDASDISIVENNATIQAVLIRP
ncbi:MAG TPA: peptidoglycan DD-metalloendopeptidase family protein [Ignavibacteria bacterium]|nr:peptidoglycan DD-metalloendopeptidase family protein [Ignavibacteria bacterium]